MGDAEREGLTLGLQEILRQFKRLCDTEGIDVSTTILSQIMEDTENSLRRFNAGLITEEELGAKGTG